MTQQQDRPAVPTNQFGTPLPHAGAHTVTPWAPPAPTGTDGVSVAGLVLAVLFWPVGLVLSAMGLHRTRGGRPGRGLAIAGLVVSLVQLAAMPLLAAIAIPTFLNQRAKAVEAELRSDLHEAALAMETAAVQGGTGYPAALPPVTTHAGTDQLVLVSVAPDWYCLRAVGGDRVLYSDSRGVVSELPCG